MSDFAERALNNWNKTMKEWDEFCAWKDNFPEKELQNQYMEKNPHHDLATDPHYAKFIDWAWDLWKGNV